MNNHRIDYKFDHVNRVVAYVIAGNKTIGAVKHLEQCNHTEFRFADCQILFHLHVPACEHDHVKDCIHALSSINFEHKDAPAMSIPFHHRYCTLDAMHKFAIILEKTIAEAKEVLADIARGGQMPPNEVIMIPPFDIDTMMKDDRNVHPRARTDSHEMDSLKYMVEGFKQNTERKDEKQMPRRRPLNASESILGFIEYLMVDSKYTYDQKLLFRKQLDITMREFSEKNNLPAAREGWEQFVIGI